MNYPNGIQKEFKKVKSYSNRGMNLEWDLNDTNLYYLNNNIAVIYKKPTPIKILKLDYTTNKITNAFFETVSGFTTTGASVITDLESLSHCTLFWRSFTHWIGGMGVFVFIMSILPLMGGSTINLMRAESPGPSVSKLVPRVKDTARILYLLYFV